MKSLVDKLGYKTGMGTQVWGLPEALRQELRPLFDETSATPSFRIAFALNSAQLARVAEEVAAAYQPGGHLWIGYPKKSGSIRSDFTRDIGWEPIQALNLYGVTQIALDADWSALRFRYREEIERFTRATQTGG